MSHKDVYCNASNIATIFVGQYLFMLRIERETTKFTLFFERYNLSSEEKTVLNSTTIELPEKISADIIKFIQARSFSAPIAYVTEEERDNYVKDLDVIVIYRNDDKENNETFGFDIRSLHDLSLVKYRRANTKKEWLDVGGRKNWRKYAFPAFKFSQEESMEQLDVNHEVVLVCPF